MKLQKFSLASGLGLGWLGLCGLAAGCKDGDPCDPGQTEKGGQCYPVLASGGTTSGDSSGAAEGGLADTIAGAPSAGAPSAALDTAVGTPCQDTTESSDCGGRAPVCADLSPLGQSVMCTLLDCAAGEANAGACPGGFSCFVVPGYPSLCTKD
jgi:hypothetical protein